MKINYRLSKSHTGHALRRFGLGIKQSMPEWCEMVENEGNADFVIIPVINITDCINLPPNAIISMHCFLTANGPMEQWYEAWSKAAMIFSYLKLPIDNYLRIPLGYDPNLFNMVNRNPHPKYDILVTGYVDEHEDGEVIKRLCNHFPNVLHIGKNFRLRCSGYHHAEGLSDTQMVAAYKNSKFVAGMRMIEGFELPIIEGAACGAKPITLDLECYRHWFEGIACFVDPDHLDEDLSLINDMNWYTDMNLVKKFTWDNAMKPFWDEMKRRFR